MDVLITKWGLIMLMEIKKAEGRRPLGERSISSFSKPNQITAGPARARLYAKEGWWASRTTQEKQTKTQRSRRCPNDESVVTPPPGRASPAQKVKKESPGESPGESAKVLSDPLKTSQKRVS